MQHKSHKSKKDLFLVTGDHAALLNFSAASHLVLAHVTYHVGNALTESKIRQQYPQLFQGVGFLRDLEVRLHADNSVPPVAQLHCRIPFAMRKPLETELT